MQTSHSNATFILYIPAVARVTMDSWNQVDYLVHYRNLPAFMQCANYSENKGVQQHDYIAFHLTLPVSPLKAHYFWKAVFLHSWNEASKLCEDAGGTLPILSSRGAQDEFSALLKLSAPLSDVLSGFEGMIQAIG